MPYLIHAIHGDPLSVVDHFIYTTYKGYQVFHGTLERNQGGGVEFYFIYEGGTDKISKATYDFEMLKGMIDRMPKVAGVVPYVDTKWAKRA